jgi:hypothetical protein
MPKWSGVSWPLLEVGSILSKRESNGHLRVGIGVVTRFDPVNAHDYGLKFRGRGCATTDSTASDIGGMMFTKVQAPQRVIPYILLVWSCIAGIIWSCYNGGADEIWPRWKKLWGMCQPMCAEGQRIYARSDEDPFMAAPPRHYMGGEVSGSGPSQLQVDANPN